MGGADGVDFRALFEGAPGLYVVLDPDFRIVAASDAYLEATRTRREDVVGRDVFEVFPNNPDDPAANGPDNLRRSLARLRDRGVADTMAVQQGDIRRPSGEGGDNASRYWSRVNSPVFDDDRRLRYVIQRVEDVTELQEPNRELREASEANNEFLSRMSHELRTPLAAIMGFSELLELRELGEKEDGWVKTIQVAGRHLLALVDEVMDLSRIESGTLSISPETVPIQPLVDEAFQLMQPVAAGHGIALHQPVIEPGVSPYVLADQQRLTQVIINLVSNAIKYNRPGGEVAILVRRVDAEWVRVAVTDTGPGIDPALLPRLFVPFERLTADGSDIEGTGLGLALSRNLIESMRGRVGVDSTIDVGSTFWLEVRASEPIAVEKRRSDEPLLAARTYARRRRLLYVEDVVANIRLVEEILERRPSVTLLPAMLGKLGLELAHEHRPDLILLDLHLPDMNGEEALVALRGDPATRDTPVVVLTADATRRHADRLLQLGARAYLTKPIGIRELLQTMDEYLDT